MTPIVLDYGDCQRALRDAQTSLQRLIRDGRDLNGELRTALAVVQRSLAQVAGTRRRRAA